MTADRAPVTAAVRILREHAVPFEIHVYAYEERGGTAVSSRELGVSEHGIVKTLVMEDDAQNPLVVLMHGDKQVSAKQLARAIGARAVQPCKPEVAEKHSGYRVGGTSPLGTKRVMPIYAQKTILDLPRIWINGGRRGFLVSLDPRDLVAVLKPTLVDVAIEA